MITRCGGLCWSVGLIVPSANNLIEESTEHETADIPQNRHILAHRRARSFLCTFEAHALPTAKGIVHPIPFSWVLGIGTRQWM